MNVKYTEELLAKLNVNPDTDAVAVFRPGDGCAFHIPDSFSEMPGDRLPTHIRALFAMIYVLVHIKDDPKVKAFVHYLDKATLAEVMAADEDAGAA